MLVIECQTSTQHVLDLNSISDWSNGVKGILYHGSSDLKNTSESSHSTSPENYFH